MSRAGSIRIGIGGWSFAPWRETFYPAGTRPADELSYASSVLATIEINGTFYRTQNEHVFAGWRASVPAGFVFAVKASRGATASSDPERCAASIARFMGSGLGALGDALGPILWQFGPTRRFDAGFFERFLALLPDTLDGRLLRHVIEFRHPSGRDPAFAALLAARGVALALIARPDQTAFFVPGRDFTYVRIEETVDEAEHGLADPDIARWAGHLRAFAAGRVPDELAPGLLGAPPRKKQDVFAYVIAGAKHRNPAAARALTAAVADAEGKHA